VCKLFLPGSGTAVRAKRAPYMPSTLLPRRMWFNAMPFVPVENVAMVEIRQALALQKCENTIFAQSVDAFDGARLSSLVNTVRDWWVESLGPLLSDLVTLTEVVATDLTTETSGQVSVTGADSPGGEIGGSAANNVTLAVSFRTASRGRSFRGRNYLIGIPLTQFTSTNVVDSAWVSSIIGAYIDLKTALNDADFAWVVVSRFSGVDLATGDPIPREAGIATLVTNTVVVDNVVDSQRRRLPGRGQ